MSGEVRYWRHRKLRTHIRSVPQPFAVEQPAEFFDGKPDIWEPVHVLTAAELAAVKAEAWDEGWDANEDQGIKCEVTGYTGGCGECGECLPPNPFRADQIEEAGRG